MTAHRIRTEPAPSLVPLLAADRTSNLVAVAARERTLILAAADAPSGRRDRGGSRSLSRTVILTLLPSPGGRPTEAATLAHGSPA